MNTSLQVLMLAFIAGFFLLPNSILNAQENDTSKEATTALQEAFAPLVGKTWQAEEQWENGPLFKQEIRFEWNLEQTAVIAHSAGFINREQTEWGQRNFGVRRFDLLENKLVFTEYDIFGGATSGVLKLDGKTITYEYNYGDEILADTWEPVDENTYNYSVVSLADDGSISEPYLSTQFVVKSEESEVMIPTDMSLPYRQIPDYPEEYNACTVAARMIDGLGFRYYWATEGLRQADLDYSTTPDSRTSAETLDHIYGLVNVVYNAVMEQPTISGGPRETLTYAEKRANTLKLLIAASDKLKASTNEDMERFDLVFQRGDSKSEYPFWNNLNGPMADAIWHVGQVVAFRRASGNPFNSNVSVLSGKLRK